jgi:hypothetical protein
MSGHEMHLGGDGGAVPPGRTCDTCGRLFAPGRAWARFCDARCRNAFHGAEARKEAIKAAALGMYTALDRIIDGAPQGADVVAIAKAAIKDLKPPVEPKALLEKAKA